MKPVQDDDIVRVLRKTIQNFKTKRNTVRIKMIDRR